MFLQAAGMPAGTARQLEKGPTGAALDDDLGALVALAVQVTERPGEVTPADVAAAAAAARSPAEYLDAVGVIVGFNFVTRVANALGVEPEISPWLLRTERPRHLVLRLWSLLLRGLVDLRHRRTTWWTPGENLAALERLFGDAGLRPLPGYFRQLAAAPQLLEAQRELLEALLKRGNPAGPVRMDVGRFLAVGLVALEAMHAGPVLRQVAEWVGQHGRQPPEQVLARAAAAEDAPASPEAVVLRFARDVTRCSYRITRERVDELRAWGLADEDVLDLVCATALWNAGGRLEVLLAGLPGADEPAPATVSGAAGPSQGAVPAGS
jgi:alkylhydroperoxidase family enzyme